MQRRLGVDDAELASILRMVESRLEISFEALRHRTR
jgi:hypothetical protein